MEQLVQQQQLRIDQLEQSNRDAAAMAAREREQLISDFRNEIAGIKTQLGSAAAEAATNPASGSLRTAASALESRLVDTRVIGKPDMYYGEREKWRDWSMVLKAYMMAVDPDYVDAFEGEGMKLMKSTTALENLTNETHIEIHPSLTLGFMANQIIFPENNPYPRNAFSCGQAKQGVSLYSTNLVCIVKKGTL